MVRVGSAFELLGVEYEEHEVGDGEREDREAECANECGARRVEIGNAVALAREPPLHAHCCPQLLGTWQWLNTEF